MKTPYTEPNISSKLEYLGDIFDKLIAFNLSPQGNNMLIFKILERVSAFRRNCSYG